MMMRSIRALLALCAAMLFAAATFQMTGGNAECVLKVEVGGVEPDGTFKDVTWRPNTEKCEGDCDTSGKCKLNDLSTSNKKKLLECQCDSTTGNTGCRAQSLYERLGPNDPWVYKGIKCEGEDKCPPAKSACDWKSLGQSSGNDDWATCQCQ
jgi:hypothetical protein